MPSEKGKAFPAQRQSQPGKEAQMAPRPASGEFEYRGSAKLKGKAALITGGDSGIGRAVALAFAREGANVAFAYLEEDQEAKETRDLVEKEGVRCLAFRFVEGRIGGLFEHHTGELSPDELRTYVEQLADGPTSTLPRPSARYSVGQMLRGARESRPHPPQ